MFCKKSVVLSGVNNSSQKAVLTFDCDGKMAKGRLRLYNFGTEPKGILSLGLFQGGDVVKAGLIRTSQNLYTFACALDEVKEDFTCAVVNFVGGQPSPILYGKGEGFCDSEELLGRVVEQLKQAENAQEVKETLDEFGVDYDDELKAEIEEEIDKSMAKSECNDCENCPYKKYYLENFKANNLSTLNENNSEEIKEEKSSKSFYLDLKPQIDNLFAENPSEEYLEKLIPDSKWVKVNVDDSGNYYVLGLIYDGEKLLYICYGVPGVYQKNAPRELSGYPVWFPLEESKPQGFGYWLSYQDAESGESIMAVVE